MLGMLVKMSMEIVMKMLAEWFSKASVSVCSHLAKREEEEDNNNDNNYHYYQNYILCLCAATLPSGWRRRRPVQKMEKALLNQRLSSVSIHLTL